MTIEQIFRESNVEIFGAPHCSYCTEAKRFCERNNIEYTYYDIFVQDDAMQDLANRGMFRGVPQIFIDGEHIGGFSELARMVNAIE